MDGDPSRCLPSQADIAAIFASRDRAIRALNSLPPVDLATSMHLLLLSYVRHAAGTHGMPPREYMDRFMAIVARDVDRPDAVVVPFVPDLSRS